jgi:hypothetical protein
MRRYGDNISPDDSPEEEPYGNGQFTQVFYGGCAATFGSFQKPVNTLEKRKPARTSRARFLTAIMGFLGLKRKVE